MAKRTIMSTFISVYTIKVLSGLDLYIIPMKSRLRENGELLSLSWLAGSIRREILPQSPTRLSHTREVSAKDNLSSRLALQCYNIVS